MENIPARIDAIEILILGSDRYSINHVKNVITEQR